MYFSGSLPPIHELRAQCEKDPRLTLHDVDISDLQLLRQLPLTTLKLDYLPCLTCIQHLSELPQLRTLHIISCYKLQSSALHALQGVARTLQKLRLHCRHITDISALAKLPMLTTLDLGDTLAADLSPLQCLEELQYFKFVISNETFYDPNLTALKAMRVSRLRVYWANDSNDCLPPELLGLSVPQLRKLASQFSPYADQ